MTVVGVLLPACTDEGQREGATRTTPISGSPAEAFPVIHEGFEAKLIAEARDLDASQRLASNLARQLRAHQSLIEDLTEATRLPAPEHSASTIDRTIALDLTHLLRADAQRLAESGDQLVAVERLAGIAHLARHISSSSTLHAKVNGFECLAWLTRTVEDLIDRNHFAGEPTQSLRGELQAFDPEDPLQSVVAVEVMPSQVETLLRAGASAQNVSNELVVQWEQMDPQARQQTIDAMQAACDQIKSIWKQGNAHPRIQQIIDDVDDPMARKLLEPLPAFHGQSIACRIGFKAVLNSLRPPW